jgi:acyl-CoA thioester hydrolase
MSITSGTHHHPLRIYYEDTDAGGIVYHASYLRFAERARTEMLRCLGFPHQSLIEAHGTMMVVRRLEIEYLKPARLDDMVEVRTKLTALGGASLTLSQDIVAPETGDTYVRMLVRLASVGLDGRPARLPGAFARQAELWF